MANSRINSRTSFGRQIAKRCRRSTISCSAAILRNSARPALVSRITCTRRSDSEVRRSRWPGFDQALDQPGDIAVGDHHPLRDIRQRHAVRHLVELRHQVEARQRDVEALAQPAAHLALDQGGAGQKPKPQPEFVAVIFREFDGLGLGIEDHDAIMLCLGIAARLRASNNSAGAASQNASTASRRLSGFL